MSKTLNLINKTIAMKKAYASNYFEPLPVVKEDNHISHAQASHAHEAQGGAHSFPWDQVLLGSFVITLMLIVVNLFFVTHQLVVVLNAQRETFDVFIDQHNVKVQAINEQLVGLSDNLQKSTDKLRGLSVDQKLLEISTEEVKRLSGVLLKEYSALDKKNKLKKE